MAASEGKHNKFYFLLRHMMVFSILFALHVVGRDFVHEFGSRGHLIVPCCTDPQTANQAASKREKILSAIKGTPAEHSSVGMSLCCGGHVQVSISSKPLVE